MVKVLTKNLKYKHKREKKKTLIFTAKKVHKWWAKTDKKVALDGPVRDFFLIMLRLQGGHGEQGGLGVQRVRGVNGV